MGPRQKHSQATCSTSCKHETPLHDQKKRENKENDSEPTKPLTFVTFDPDDATSFLDLVGEDALAVLGRKIDEVMADTRNQPSSQVKLIHGAVLSFTFGLLAHMYEKKDVEPFRILSQRAPFKTLSPELHSAIQSGSKAIGEDSWGLLALQQRFYEILSLEIEAYLQKLLPDEFYSLAHPNVLKVVFPRDPDRINYLTNNLVIPSSLSKAREIIGISERATLEHVTTRIEKHSVHECGVPRPKYQDAIGALVLLAANYEHGLSPTSDIVLRYLAKEAVEAIWDVCSRAGIPSESLTMTKILDSILTPTVQGSDKTTKKPKPESTGIKREELVETNPSKRIVKSRETQTDNEDLHEESAREGFVRVVIQLDEARAEVEALKGLNNDLLQELAATRNNVAESRNRPLSPARSEFPSIELSPSSTPETIDHLGSPSALVLRHFADQNKELNQKLTEARQENARLLERIALGRFD